MVKLISKELQEHVYKGGFIHCRDIHDNSCEWTALVKFAHIFNKAYKFYIPLHLIPVLLFKRRKLVQEPKRTFMITCKNIFKSCLFLAVYVSVFRYLLCVTKNTRRTVDRWNMIIASFVCGFAIILEPESRRNELAMYLVPRAFEALFNLQVQKGRVKHIKYGEVLIFAVCMSLLMYCYENEPKNIKPAFLALLKRFFGKN